MEKYRSHTKRMNGDKMDTNNKEHQQKDQERDSTDWGRTENNRHTGAEVEHHAISN
jgi:hypothetical protein